MNEPLQTPQYELSKEQAILPVSRGSETHDKMADETAAVDTPSLDGALVVVTREAQSLT